MELGIVKIWSKEEHGYVEGQSVNPDGHILLEYKIDLDDFLNEKIENIELIKEYRLGEYYFAIKKTYYLKILQRKIKKMFRNKHTNKCIIP